MLAHLWDFYWMGSGDAFASLGAPLTQEWRRNLRKCLRIGSLTLYTRKKSMCVLCGGDRSAGSFRYQGGIYASHLQTRRMSNTL